MVQALVDAAVPKMEKALEHLQEDLASLRTGRAHPGLVDGLTIEYYGQNLPLKQVATIATPDAKTIAITPWDHNAMDPIEKAIRESQSIGLTPNNDGHTIRLNIPPLTEDRRRDIVKAMGEKVESCRISLRNIRHEVINEVKRMEKDKQATQDDTKFAEQELNKKIEQFQAKIVEIEKAKEKELMEV